MEYVSGIYDKDTFLFLQRLILVPCNPVKSNASLVKRMFHYPSNTNPNMQSISFNTTVIHIIFI